MSPATAAWLAARVADNVEAFAYSWEHGEHEDALSFATNAETWQSVLDEGNGVAST